jgi:hypothetical protein
MENYRQTSTGAVADVDFSKEVEDRNKKIEAEYAKFLKEAREGENPENPGVVNRMVGGSMCGRATGQGYGKARKR